MSNIYVKTYGCSFNQLDSEIMSGKLIEAGHKITENENNADLFLINSCTVKNLSETKFFQDVRKYKEKGKKIVVSGCITQAEESYMQTKLKDISVIGTNDLDKIAYIVDEAIKNNPIQIVSKLGRKKENELVRIEKEKLRLSSPKERKNPLIEIIPINEGCLNTCSFCKTKQARGQLFSYSIESIKESMQDAIKEGVKEIYLTSQDTGCYGFDIGTNLATLLKEILKIKGDYKIRIGMGNPNHYKKIIDEILEIMISDNRIYKFLHIPLQSGSDRILDEMNRQYHSKDFKTIISKAKLKIPDITFANDIIVAYPTETKEDFKETLNAIKGTNVLNFSRFWLRPNTPATKYETSAFLSGDESKRRAKVLKETFQKQALIQNKKWIGWEGEVLVMEETDKGFKCRNDYYKPIYISKSKNINLGDRIKIKIDKVNWNNFEGKTI